MRKHLAVIAAVIFTIIFAADFKIHAVEIEFDATRLEAVEVTDFLSTSILKGSQINESLSVSNIDVSDKGELLVCLYNGTINVYDDEGNFDFSLMPNLYGTAEAFWDDNYIVLHSVRGERCYYINRSGQVENIYNSRKINSKYFLELRKVEKLETEKYTYTLNYSNLLVKIFDSNANEVIQIDNNTGETKTIFLNKSATFEAAGTLLIILIITAIVFFILRDICKKNKANRHHSQTH